MSPYSGLRSDKTKKEIDAMRKEAHRAQSKIKGGMNAVVPGIQMFGPKVGPFFLNPPIHEAVICGLAAPCADMPASHT